MPIASQEIVSLSVVDKISRLRKARNEADQMYTDLESETGRTYSNYVGTTVAIDSLSIVLTSLVSMGATGYQAAVNGTAVEQGEFTRLGMRVAYGPLIIILNGLTRGDDYHPEYVQHIAQEALDNVGKLLRITNVVLPSFWAAIWTNVTSANWGSLGQDLTHFQLRASYGFLKGLVTRNPGDAILEVKKKIQAQHSATLQALDKRIQELQRQQGGNLR